MAITGFVVYRYRQTRALTLAQFFEMRYSRNFRFVTGVLGFVAGILNFGVIPVIGGKFMVYFLDLPQSLHVFSLSIPTYLVLMGCFLTITTLITITGGQITVMIADCVQGMISQVFYVIIGVFLIAVFDWHQAVIDMPAHHFVEHGGDGPERNVVDTAAEFGDRCRVRKRTFGSEEPDPERLLERKRSAH